MVSASCVRLRISRSRTPTSIKAACCSAVFTGTNRIIGRFIASHSAFRVSRIVLAALDVGLNQLRRDQLHRVPELTRRQREQLYLEPTPPRWCYDRGLWPFAHANTLPPGPSWDEYLLASWDWLSSHL